MPVEGYDYVSGPSVSGLKGAGAHFVARYISTPGNPKNLTLHEVAALHAARIDIVTVFETIANEALLGEAQGRIDAVSAGKQLVALGAPKNAVVYFAVDFDATDIQQHAINAYLFGASQVLGHDRVGVYGGFWVVKRALDAKVCKYAWQTYAWSGGQWDPRAQLRQVQNGVHVVNAETDRDEAMAADFGQWRWARPKPKPRPRRLPAWLIRALERYFILKRRPRK